MYRCQTKKTQRFECEEQYYLSQQIYKFTSIYTDIPSRYTKHCYNNEYFILLRKLYIQFTYKLP